jgi:hypothetical protein
MSRFLKQVILFSFCLIVFDLSAKNSKQEKNDNSSKNFVKGDPIWGDVAKIKTPIDRYVGQNNEGEYLVLGTKPKIDFMIPALVFWYYKGSYQPYIMKFNSDMKLNSETKIDISEINGKKKPLNTGKISLTSILGLSIISYQPNQFDLFKWGEKFYVGCPSKISTNNYYVMRYDESQNKLLKLKTLLEVKPKNNEVIKTSNISYKKIFSQDSNYLCFYALYYIPEANQCAIAMAVYTRGMKLEWSNQFDFPYDSRDYTPTDFKLSNAGTFAISGKFHNHKLKGKHKFDGYIVAFFADQSSTELKKTKLVFEDFAAYPPLLEFNLKNRPVLVGFYKNDIKDKGINGLYLTKFNSQFDITGTKLRKFDDDFILSALSKGETRKAKKNIKKNKESESVQNFSFDKLIPTEDSGYLGIASQYYMTVTYTSNSSTGSSRTMYYHHFGDIIVMKINKTRNVDWIKKIDRQYLEASYTSIPSRLSNLNSFEFKGNYYITFFDDEKSQDDNSGKRKFSLIKKYTTYVAKLNIETGNLNRQVLLDKDQLKDFLLFGSDVYPTNDGKILLIARKKGGFGFASNKVKIGMVEIGSSSKKSKKKTSNSD